METVPSVFTSTVMPYKEGIMGNCFIFFLVGVGDLQADQEDQVDPGDQRHQRYPVEKNTPGIS